MRKLFCLILLINFGIHGQAAEFWTCQSINTVGFNWNTEEGYRWESTRIAASDLSLNIDGSSSHYTLGSQNVPLICDEYANETEELFFSCKRADGPVYDLLVFNPRSGQAALSRLGGSITSNTFYRDLVATYLFQCQDS